MSPSSKQVTKTIISKGGLKETVGTSETRLADITLNQMWNAVWLGEGADDAIKDAYRDAVAAMFFELEPRDVIEHALCGQMVTVHFAAMECFRRAAIAGQTFDARDMALRHGVRLTRIYNEQVAALNKHRGKGQQTVRVEHVNVAAGGQAIVGNVGIGGERQKNGKQAHAKQVGYAPEPTLRFPDAEREPVPVAGNGERAVPDARRQGNRSAER